MMKIPAAESLRNVLRMLQDANFLRRTAEAGANKLGIGFSRAEARCLARRAPLLLGWPGIAGIGLMVACVAFCFSTILPARDRLASSRAEALALQEQMKAAGHGEDAAPRTPEEQIADFYRLFPQDGELPQYLGKIFAVADKEGIELEKGEYKVVRDKEGGLVRFRMSFPVRGDYPRIRKYLTSLMADIPTLSLQQVKFKRQKVGDAIVEANINLVLFLLEKNS